MTISLQHTATNRLSCAVSIDVRESFSLYNWRVSPASNELVNELDGARIVLEPRLIELLCLLAEQANSVVPRTELSDKLWPRVIVNENSLTRAISTLRKKLSAIQLDTTLIETIPKKGYRLNAQICVPRQPPITTNISDVAISQPKLKFTKTTKRWTSHSITAIAASLLLASTIGIAWITGSASVTVSHKAQIADVLLGDYSQPVVLSSRAQMNNVVASDSADGGFTNQIAQTVFSRDGHLFAYIKQQSNSMTIMLGAVTEPDQAVAIFATQDTISNLQWSPAKRALLFAQSARVNTAALTDEVPETSLVMFDLETFTHKVLDGPATQNADEDNKPANDKPFNLT